MGATTCAHQEKIETVGNGIQHGTCKICGQVRRYNTLDLREKPKIIKLGRVNGAIVLPGDKDTPELPTQEAAELEAARKEPAVASEEQPQIYVGKPHNYQRGVRKWRNRCKSCELFYVHDEQTWCSSKRCPLRCPPRLRPQYRLKVEAKAAAEIPTEPKHVKKPKAPPVTPKVAPETVEEADEVCANCPVLHSYKGYRLAVKDILGARKIL